MTRSKTVAVLGGRTQAGLQRPRASFQPSSEGAFSNHRPALRALLYSSVLTGGLLLANGMAVAPAYATACGVAVDGPNSTQCIGGNDAAGLVYVADNAFPYTTGDFTLLLDTHTVTGAAGENGITFSGVTANDDGTIIVRNTSSVASGTGADGINSTAANAGTTTLISIETNSTVTGANNGIVATATGGGPIEIRTQTGTTVTGNNGAGISATGTAAGNVTVNALGAVTGTGAANDGIHAETVNGTASVTTGAGAINGGDEGIEANATGTGSASVTTGTGAVTGTAGSGILAQGASATVDTHGNVTGGIAGIQAEANNGNASVTTAGIAGTAISGTVTGIAANATGATGDAIVNAGTTVTGSTFGINASSVNGAANVTTSAAVTANAGTGINANGNSVDVDAGGNVTGTGGTGINAVADTGTVTVTTALNTTVSGTGGAGINAEAPGDVTVDPDGNVSGGTLGINAVSNTLGNVNVTTFAGTTVSGAAGDGINAETTGAGNTGNVVVDAQSTVTGAGAGSIGIDANAINGFVRVNTGAANVTGLTGGIDATATATVTVATGGNVSGGTGINAVSGTSGNVNVTTNGIAGTVISGTSGDGINAQATSGNVDVEVHTAVTGSANGIDANAVSGAVEVTTDTAAVTGGANGIDATASGAVTVNAGGTVAGNDIGINAVAANGDVNVTTAAGSTVAGGTGDDGINAEATATGNVVVLANSSVSGSAIGIDANAASGTVQVTTGTAAVSGGAGNGIDATASGDVTVGTNGNVTGTGGTGINAVSSGAGNVEVTTGEVLGGTEVIGTAGDGINASTTGAGTITIGNNTITEGSDAGIEATSGGGAIQITNDGGIANITENDFDLAIRTTGGATTIDNNATILGRVVTGNANDTLNNTSLWITEGTSDFGGGAADVVTNSSLLIAGNNAGIAETTTFAGLETLNNTGSISLRDQVAGDGSNVSDRLSTSGDYNGGGGLDVDAFLGGPGSLADVLEVGGNTSGVTQILVTDTNAGAGALNLAGITVVDVAAGGITTAGDFVLANGPIDKGLFFYDLLFDAANNNHVLVGLPDREVFETLAVVASNQEIWRETADAWSTRQENLRDVLATSHAVTAIADPPVEGSTAPMGSLWVSALGSWTERDDDASFAILNANLEFDLSYSQDIYGVVGGADFATDVGTDSRLLFGLMAGYVDSSLDFDDSDTSIDTDGATVGAYAALMSNGFFATVLVKADLLNMDFSTSEVDGEDSADVTSWGARGDFGYRFGDTFFVEPMISVDGISTKIDEFTIAGADVDAGTNESFRAGAGLRAGYGGESIRASATGRVWDVFATDNEVEIVSGGFPLGISDDDLEGVYGDVSAQIDVSLSTNATIYLKGGVLFSDDVTKPNASGGFALYW